MREGKKKKKRRELNRNESERVRGTVKEKGEIKLERGARVESMKRRRRQNIMEKREKGVVSAAAKLFPSRPLPNRIEKKGVNGREEGELRWCSSLELLMLHSSLFPLPRTTLDYWIRHHRCYCGHLVLLILC
ncbi:uncharacterized protein DS421_10g303810 [Arachis hypogaea]|nr:uncharacterized protein DS421_10g303810 [Arachis hypogaea]